MEDSDRKLEQLLKSGDLDRAKRIVDSIDTGSLVKVKLLLQCGAVYRGLGDQKKAAECSARAANLQPDNFSVSIICSQDLLILGQVDKAEAVLDAISPQTPQQKLQVQFHRSTVLYQKKEFRSATRMLVDIVKQNPEFVAAHMELAHALLMHGKWRAGWIEYEWRFSLPKSKKLFPRFKMPHWDGRDNLPHILLLGDQGYGDCFQFSRYIPLVAQHCQRVTLARSEPLARLFNSVPWITVSYTQWKDTPLASAYCYLSGLPRLFSTRPDTIPDCSGILRARDEDVARWKIRMNETGSDPVLRVGLAWSGRLEFDTNYLRAVPFEKLEALLDIPGIQFFSLQVGAPASRAQGKNITDLSMELVDFAETAAAMETLDLIISSDTSIPHLAGALGRPTWVLLSYAPDWRWGSEGTTSPWYPTMRVFRQDQTRDWQSVVGECKTMLVDILNADEPLARLQSITLQDNSNRSSPYV